MMIWPCDLISIQDYLMGYSIFDTWLHFASLIKGSSVELKKHSPKKSRLEDLRPKNEDPPQNHL